MISRKYLVGISMDAALQCSLGPSMQLCIHKYVCMYVLCALPPLRPTTR